MREKRFLRPAALFFGAAVLLAVNGVIFLHSEWPPMSWPKISFTTPDFGRLLVWCAVIFAAIGLVYLALTRLLRRPMNPALGYAHFAISAAAILVGMFLDYWFNVTYKKIPGEDFWHATFRGLSNSFEGTVWASLIFAAAQLIFLFNLCWTLVASFRARPQVERQGHPAADV
jgi:hypothetical protein